MAPLERGGIELIVKNFGGFINSLGKANSAYSQFNKSSTSAANAVTKAGERVVAANSRIVSSQRNLQKALNADSAAWHRLAIARRAFTQAQKQLEDAKVAHAVLNDAQSLAFLTKAQENAKNASDRLAIAQRGYSSALETMRNARDRLTAAEAAGARAQLVLQGLLGQGSRIAAMAGMAIKVLGVAVAALGIALGAAAIGWKIFTKAAGVVVGVLKGMVGIVASVAREIKELFSRAISVTLGLGIYDVFRKMADGVRGLFSEVIPAISYFQKLNIQLEALQARDVAKEMGIPMAEAFDEASKRAKGLFQWIANLAVKTPFTAQSISETLAMANAMGLNIPLAKEMTKATIDFTAAMGLSEDHMFRIIYNFGQMLAQGKLNGREFRDLANSFVPVWQMMDNMGKKAGMTAEEFKKLAFEGGVPVQAFFEEFIRMAETDFAGAAQKMARTLEGVTNNMKDFLQIIVGTSILGPVMGRIAERLSGALDKMLNPNIRREAERIGGVLLKVFTGIEDSVNKLFGALRQLAVAFGIPIPKAHALANAVAFLGILIKKGIDKITQFVWNLRVGMTSSMDETQSKFATWGYNLVATFAAGMAKAINLVVMVINTLSRILSAWFRGGSPPKIAKNIDKWGAEMIAEWVKGWTNFDISTFSDLADTVESYLRSISRKFSETGLIPAILGARQNIAAAINNIKSGMMTAAQAADFVFKKVKKLTSEFKNYITALFDVEAASRRVAQAEELVAKAQEKVAAATAEIEKISSSIKIVQDELNDVTAEYESILEDLNKQLEKVTTEYDEQRRLQEINQAIGTGLLTDAEKERLEMEKKALLIKQQIRNTEDERDVAVGAIETRLAMLEKEKEAAELRKDAAEAEVAAVEALVTAAEEELRIAEDRLALSKAIIDEQIKQNDLVQEQIDLLKQIADAAAAAAAGAAGAGGEGVDWESMLNIEGLDRAEQAYADRMQGLADMFKQQEIDKIFSDMQLAVDGFLKSLEGKEGVFAPVETALKNLDLAFGGLISTIGIAGGGAEEGIVEKALRFEKGNVKPIEDLAYAVGKIADALLKLVDSSVFTFFETLVSTSDSLSETDWTAVGTGVSNVVLGVAALAKEIGEKGPLKGTLSWLSIAFKSTLRGMYDNQGGEYNGTGSGLSVTEFRTMTTEELQGLSDDIVLKSIIPEMMKAMYDSMTTVLGDIYTWIKDIWIVDVLRELNNWVTSIIGPGGIIPTFLTNLLTNIIIGMIVVWLWWTGKWDEFKKYVNDIFNNPDGIIAKVNTALDDLSKFFGPDGTLASAISTFISTVLATLITKLGEVWELIQNIINNKGKASAPTTTPPGTPTTGPQTGGIVKRGMATIAGEMGRELIFPLRNSLVIPNWLTEKILAPAMSGSNVNNTYITNVEVNPTYRNMQSEASVYYDLTAALAATRR